MCVMGEWAAVMAFAAAYHIQDDEIVNAVATDVGGQMYSTPAALRAGIVKSFATHGINMV